MYRVRGCCWRSCSGSICQYASVPEDCYLSCGQGEENTKLVRGEGKGGRREGGEGGGERWEGKESGERGGGGEKAKREREWKREREREVREDGKEGDIPTSKLLSGI